MKKAIVILALVLSVPALAETKFDHKVDDVTHSVSKGTKKTVRSAQDKTCELVHGKLHCVGKKIQHKAEDVTDEIK